MPTIRRTYAYLLAFAGLAMLTVSLANMVQLVLDLVLRPPGALSDAFVRDSISVFAAGTLVGLPVWLLHWVWMERAVRSDPAERASNLRRLYLYAILAAATLVIVFSAREAIVSAIEPLASVRTSTPIADAIVRPLPFTLVALVVWFMHWRIAARDRRLVGESAGSATLRRWYIFGLAFVGFAMLLAGAAAVLESLILMFTTPPQNGVAGLPEAVATALVALCLWLAHWLILPRRLTDEARVEDGQAVLRSVYLFLALALAVAGALLGASQLLYYAVGRALGIDRPGGVGGDLLPAAAAPGSVTLIYAAGWLYQREAVRRQAMEFVEAPRQAGTRRLYTYLVALVALAVLARGVGGLLWSLGDVLFNAPAAFGGTAWRDQLALSVTLTIVGLPVWVLHWRPAPTQPTESHSLARRLYVYLSLIGATLTLIGSLAVVLYRLIGLALGTTFTVELITDLAHAAAVAVVGGVIAAYHWRVLRADARRMPAPPVVEPMPGAAPIGPESQPPPSKPAEALVEIRAEDAAGLERALAALRQTGVRVTLR